MGTTPWLWASGPCGWKWQHFRFIIIWDGLYLLNLHSSSTSIIRLFNLFSFVISPIFQTHQLHATRMAESHLIYMSSLRHRSEPGQSKRSSASAWYIPLSLANYGTKSRTTKVYIYIKNNEFLMEIKEWSTNT